MEIICPCCKSKKEKKKLNLVNALFPFEAFISVKNQSYLESFMIVASQHPNLYQWACDTCIKDKRAILGSPKRQYYTFKSPIDTAIPYLAYFDKRFTCQICKNKTVFTKEEQKYWYEELSFIVYSRPTTCKPCRKEVRKTKHLNTELSELLKDGIPKEKDKLLRIADIYKEMDKQEKMQQYLNAAKKK